MSENFVLRILKYSGQVLVIYLLLKYIPKEPISDLDALIAALAIVSMYAILKYVIMLTYDGSHCQKTCNRTERLENVTPPVGGEPDGQIFEQKLGETLAQGLDPVTGEYVGKPLLPPTTTQPAGQPAGQPVGQPAAQPAGQWKWQTTGQPKEPTGHNPNGTISGTPVGQASGIASDPTQSAMGYTQQPDGSYTMTPHPNPHVARGSMRDQSGVIPNDMRYNDYNTLPMGGDLDNKAYEQGYSFLPPSKWYPTPPHPPICVSEKSCPVCPIFTTGAPLDVKEWNEASRISPPDNINTQYITEKLNTGR